MEGAVNRMINAFYFGEKDTPLFGVHLSANPATDRNESIVICPPIGHEYTRSHKTIKLLAEHLSRIGFSVLRFSYYSVGDSAGESNQGNLDQWLKDISSAVNEAIDLTGNTKVSLLGLRIGALLALEASKTIHPNKLILWEPVESGSSFLEQIKVMHEFAITDPERFYLTENSITETSNEFLGHCYTQELQSQLSQLKIDPSTNYQANDVIAVTTESENSRLLSEVTSITTRPLISYTSTTNWRDSRQIGRMFIASQAISLLENCLSGD